MAGKLESLKGNPQEDSKVLIEYDNDLSAWGHITHITYITHITLMSDPKTALRSLSYSHYDHYCVTGDWWAQRNVGRPVQQSGF
jgi:hypothetical protein